MGVTVVMASGPRNIGRIGKGGMCAVQIQAIQIFDAPVFGFVRCICSTYICSRMECGSTFHLVFIAYSPT